MLTALDRAARSPRAGAGLALASGALVAGAVFFGGGSGRDSVLWLGGAAALALTAGLVVALLGRTPGPAPGRPGLVLLGSLGALVLWEGLSVLWSVAPDRSWDSLNKSLAAACFLGLGLAAGSLGPRALRIAAAGLAALLGAALAWSLAGKAVPALFPDGARAARLRSPVGYWNALALLADFALPLGLWLAVRRAHLRPARAGGVVLIYAATLAVLLTASRTGVVAGAVALVLWLLLAQERVEGALTALAGIAPAAAVAGWAFTRPALVDDLQPHGARAADGAWFGLLALAGGVAAAALAHPVLRRPLADAARRSLGRGLALLAAFAAAAALVGLTVSVGNPVTWAADQFRGGAQVSQGPERLTSIESNNRWQWWQEAWHVFRADPAQGAGAGTFEVARKRYRDNGLNVTQPHNLALQLLADTGLVGLALGLGFALAGAVAARGALRRLDGGERAAAVALAVLPAAYLVHALADYDLDFLAVTAPTLFVLGTLAAAGRPPRPLRRSPLAALGAVAVCLAVLWSLAAPRLAARDVGSALRAIDRGDPAAALPLADRAGSLDPFSLAPLFTRARAHERRGDERAALEAYNDAVRLQPLNPDTWYELGVFEVRVLGAFCAGYVHLNRAYTLDPAGRRWTKGGVLDVARDYVNGGDC